MWQKKRKVNSMSDIMDDEQSSMVIGGSRAQSVGGFKVVTYTMKKGKESEKLRLVLEAEVDEITSGQYDMGDVMKAFLDHATGESAVALRVFMDK